MAIYKYEIEIILTSAIKEGAIDWKGLKLFFEKNSWFGTKFKIKDREGGVVSETTKIIDLLEPGFKGYMTAVKKASKNQMPYHEMMLATDSLVLKVEGIIREMYRALGKPTLNTKNAKNGEPVSYEMDLGAFLNNDFSENIFGKDLVLVMKYFLTEPVGHNLRNNIGHCLFQKENYSMFNLHVLFIILIRLGNYKIESNEKSKKK